jgi:hypothetical protein
LSDVRRGNERGNEGRYFCFNYRCKKVQDVEFADAKYAERGKKALDDLTREIWMHGWLNLLTMLYIIGTVVIR